jgi:hypothetical protein
MEGTKMKFLGKLLLYTFIALVLGVVSLFIMKKTLLNKVRVSQTNTNLIETIDKNLFKTYQMSIDTFINYNNRYTLGEKLSYQPPVDIS